METFEEFREESSSRVKNVDFLRFIFSLLIAFHHFTASDAIRNSTNTFVKTLPLNTYNLPFIVDFFFIVSGFFLIYAYKDIPTLDFIKKKFCNLFPLMAFYVISIRFLSLLGVTNPSAEPVFSLLLLDNIGITLRHSGVAWFISSYFFVICLYYYLLHNFPLKYVKLLFFLGIYLSYAFLVHANNGNIAQNKTYFYILNGGVLRAIAGIGIGCFIAWNSTSIKTLLKNKLLCTLTETSLLCCMLYFLMINNPGWNSLIYLFVFIFLFSSFLAKGGIISYLCEKDWSVRCGKYALAIYMTHEPLLRFIRPVIMDHNLRFIDDYFLITVFLYLSLVMTLAFIVHRLIEVPGEKIMKRLLLPKTTQIMHTNEKNMGGGYHLVGTMTFKNYKLVTNLL